MKSFHAYELHELFQTYKLLSHNFYRDEPSLKLIEDAVKIRVGEKEQRAQIKADHLRDLIEGLKLHKKFNKRLDSSLRSLIKDSYLLDTDRKLFVQYLTYVADFESPLDEALRSKIQVAFDLHKPALTP